VSGGDATRAATLVLMGADAADEGSPATAGHAGSILNLAGRSLPPDVAGVLAIVLAESDAGAFVVLDLARVVAPSGLDSLSEALVPGASAVSARVLDASGQRVVFDGGSIDLRTGPVRRSEHEPAAVRHDGPLETLWFDPRAFALTREAASLIVALPLPTALDAVAAGWQIWRAGGTVRMSATTVVRLRDGAQAESAPSPQETRTLLGALLEPGTLAASGVRLEGVLDEVLAARSLLRVPRARSDAELLAAIAAPPFAAPALEPRSYSVPGPSPDRPRVTLLSSDSIGPSMAGPGIRTVELARALAERFDVSVLARAVTGAVDLPGSYGELRREDLVALASGRDPLVLQGPLTDWYPPILAGTAPIAVDLYDPMNLEALEHPDAATHVPYALRLLIRQIVRGDFFLCASERQRDYWLGMLAACGRLDVDAYREDPDLRALIDVVPFGLPRDAPVRSGPGPRDEIEGIGASDPLFVWNGGLWDWFDPETLLDATALARTSTPDIRVLFMGVQRPGEAAPSAAAQALMRRSDELGLTGKHVFFRTWTPYEVRQNTYLEATAAVSLHHAHLESRFSFRTRVLDCIWATVPILGTEGDVLAELVDDEGLGITVRPGDVEGVADALAALAGDRDGVTTLARTRLAAVAPRFEWATAAAPLAAWLERAEPRPRHALPELPAIALPPPAAGGWLGPRAHRVGRALRARLG
jgi:glycosyltransferase involved in cell wall biosynthesis